MASEQFSAEMVLFYIIYGVTGAIPFIAAVYLLFRRGNAFAPGVEPPLRLRRWAAAFFMALTLAHVWWYLFYVYSGDVKSPSYVLVAMIDCVGLLTTVGGTLLAMLQDRRRPVWPVFAAMVPFLAFGVVELFYPNEYFINITTIYVLSLYVLFSVYIAFAVRRYGRWLNENYADLENKKVWLSQVVSLFCLLLFILYAFVDVDNILLYILHFTELVLFALLLWRVETLPQLGEYAAQNVAASAEDTEMPEPELSQIPVAVPANVDITQIERLLAEHCVDTKLYLQHDLTLQQLAQAVGTNRFYLSQYFSRQSITYNSYINNLRINYFINRYEEAVESQRPFTVQQLASESGYRSYSTFSLAFKQRMGQSVTAWMRQPAV